MLCNGHNLGSTDLNPNTLRLLRDVAMVRNKWLTNGVDSDRQLTDSEMAGFIAGYIQERALTEAERPAQAALRRRTPAAAGGEGVRGRRRVALPAARRQSGRYGSSRGG